MLGSRQSDDDPLDADRGVPVGCGKLFTALGHNFNLERDDLTGVAERVFDVVALGVGVRKRGDANDVAAVIGIGLQNHGIPQRVGHVRELFRSEARQALEEMTRLQSAGSSWMSGSGGARRFSSVECQYVVGTVAEIFANGLTHARSAVGILACGQLFPAKEHLPLSAVDLGVTIPGSLAAARGRREESIDASRAVAWAFEPGHSTLQTSRGLGLAILRTFIRESGATLRVYSGRASVRIHGDSWEAHAARRFPGTLIDLELPTAEVRLPDGRERYD